VYPLQRLNPVPCGQSEIPSTPPHRDPALISAIEPILVVTMPLVAETFNCDIDEMTNGTDFTLIH